MFGNIGATEIIVIAVVALLLFGPKKLPEMLQSVGKGIKEFKKSLNEVEEEIKNSVDDKK
ncbi:MAG: twin-arginine translocase TatA/TatE family subunit [Ignavibacteria bacterium CG_4_8_14_3_um_filter_37_9]|nr:twin-arginine translocase TatA/TatE family subunit [Ignavibacteria bacterium]OIO13896.1 MAG: Sec-independent protein translocase TatA [Ignavibacteria bacterium CG1_02_37_35]PIP79750.1 MAG: twin-arginine translocase TatA/TatE family subunit [Ignavibacteria bacterium CG22_combo_CG10-13_8_21_14_all_37_15]PIS45248.1 MAG: twin-arginine translocase TatA/TatE family subunit [Ignavibacteria bacterium CG08_land_8_20_14_0_20_37_9]PIX00136.1 MAG: twin-arginine translocase TatA/TatE family subunit [Igna